MNKIEALKLIYKRNSVVQHTADKLVLIKPGMTVAEAAKACKMATNNIYILIRKYGLKLTNRRGAELKSNWAERMKIAYVPQWDKSLTVLGNARKMNISYQLASKICREFNLNKGIATRLRLTTQKHIEKIKDYYKKGLRDSEIARCMGITRERVRQLSLMKDF